MYLSPSGDSELKKFAPPTFVKQLHHWEEVCYDGTAEQWTNSDLRNANAIRPTQQSYATAGGFATSKSVEPVL